MKKMLEAVCRLLFGHGAFDYEKLCREDERKDSSYLDGFTGEKNGAAFEDASCGVKFFYGNGRLRPSIRGKMTSFKSGKILSGDYECDEWLGGEFCGGTLKCRFWRGGVFAGKLLVCDQFCGGECASGAVDAREWVDGVFNGNVLSVNDWLGGEFRDGSFHGKWRGGKWVGGKFHGIDLADGSLNKEI